MEKCSFCGGDYSWNVGGEEGRYNRACAACMESRKITRCHWDNELYEWENGGCPNDDCYSNSEDYDPFEE